MNKELYQLPKHLTSRFLYVFIFLSCFFSVLKSRAQEMFWAIQSPNITGGELIATDQEGNMYLTAYFEKELQIGNQILKEESGRFFLVKFTPDQKVLWVLQMECPMEDLQIQGETIYLFGHFKNQFRIAGEEVFGNEYYTAFIAQLNPEGQLIWHKTLSGKGDVLAKEMTLDSLGNVFICGNFEETVVLGDTILHKIRKKNIYLAKYKPDGEFGWASQATGGLTAFTGIHVWGLTWDSTGHLLLMGNLSGEAFFGKTGIVSSHEVFAGEGAVYNSDIFLARYTLDGQLIWVKNIAQNAEAQDMICSDNGSIYLTGYFSENSTSTLANFDGKKLKTAQNQAVEQVFVAKYSPLGNLIWLKRGTSPFNNRGISIATDQKNKYVYITGYFYKNLSVTGSDDLFSEHQGLNSDIFLLCFQANGKFIFLEKAAGVENDHVSDSWVDTQENWLLTGRFKKELIFRHTQLHLEHDKSNAFVLKIHLKKIK
ncbi:MAG: hypothetical protein NW226_21660 [Microscillaceae bacterium]|nr:hypothetical protein [Microscillaceae bacterium]